MFHISSIITRITLIYSFFFFYSVKFNSHEDIDAFFSMISKHLRKKSTICPDPASMHTAFRDAFPEIKHKPVVRVLDQHEVYDFTALYKDCIDPWIAYHSKPHQYKIVQVDGTTLTFYKMWAQSTLWLPSRSPPAASATTVVAEMTKKQRQNNQDEQSMEAVEDDLYTSIPSYELRNEVDLSSQQHELFINEAELVEQQRGIQWLHKIPNLGTAKFIEVDPIIRQCNMKKAEAIARASTTWIKNSHFHNASVFLKSWEDWLVHQKKIWSGPQLPVELRPLPPLLPEPSSEGTTPQRLVVADSAPAEPADGVEIIPYKSARHGEFSRVRSKKKRLAATGSSGDVDCSEPLLGQPCLFVFQDPENAESHDEFAGIGIVKEFLCLDNEQKQCACQWTNCTLVKIQWCPPKPGTKKKKQSLYRKLNTAIKFQTKKQAFFLGGEWKTNTYRYFEVSKRSILLHGLSLAKNGCLTKKHHDAFEAALATFYSSSS